MKKRTLIFSSLQDLVDFSRVIHKGYLINTVNKTITSEFTLCEIERALDEFNGRLMQTSRKVFSYAKENEVNMKN